MKIIPKLLVIIYISLMSVGYVCAVDQANVEAVLPTIHLDDGLAPIMAVCASCHGEQGAAIDMPSIPILAHQHATYLSAQLIELAKGSNGNRSSDIMQPIAAALSADEISKISEYYARLKQIEQSAPNRLDLIQGERIYLGGVLQKNIPACSSCHSPTGSGNDRAGYPRLAGQHAEYLIAQLQHYREGSRHHVMMSKIANSLTDAEIEAVAYYLQGLRSRDTL
ncbi:MAG: c-type cytochrome [Gammaproteobacteria bacterium]|nr:c-type cytochrome [Gammaproteobacteria bacterium]